MKRQVRNRVSHLANSSVLTVDRPTRAVQMPLDSVIFEIGEIELQRGCSIAEFKTMDLLETAGARLHALLVENRSRPVRTLFGQS